MDLIWLKNKGGQTNGSVSYAKQGTVSIPGVGVVPQRVQIIFTEASEGMIAVPREDLGLILVCGCPSTEAKRRALETGGKAPDCGSLWMIADDQNPSAKVKKGTWLEDARGKRVS